MPPTISKKSSPSEEETRDVRDEITSIYQKLLDGKNRFSSTDQSNEFKDILTEAKNVIRRVKHTRGTVEDYKMFCLLLHTVDEMSKNTNHTVDEISNNTNTDEQKFDVEEYAQNNSGNVIVTELQVVSLGKEVSKYFTRAPTIKFVLGALGTGVGDGETSVKINDLPNELLRYILFMVSPEDRKMAVLVSQRWRKVGEDPILWKWSVVKIRSEEDVNKLSIRRIRFVQEIVVFSYFNLQTEQQLEKLFQATLELPKLRKIQRLEYLDISAVNAQLLGKALGRLEVLQLENDLQTTTNDQRVAIFSEMAEKNLVKDLSLGGMDLRTLEVDASVLAKAMSNLHKLQLSSDLTTDQAQKIFKSISENKNQLNVVDLFGNSMNLSSIDPRIFGEVLAKVNYVKLFRTDTSSEQLRALFVQMGLNSRIKSLTMLRERNLLTVDPKLVAKALPKLDVVVLNSNIPGLTNQQVQAVFTELKQNCELKHLDLGENNLSFVDTDDLATVVTNIEEVLLDFTDLSTEQISDVLSRVQENSKLKKLSMYCNRIVQVDPAIITRAKEIIDLGVSINWDNWSDESEDGFNYESDEDDEYIAIESDTEFNEDQYEYESQDAVNGAIFLIVWNLIYLLSLLVSDQGPAGGWDVFFEVINHLGYVINLAFVIVALKNNDTKLLIHMMVFTSLIQAIFYFLSMEYEKPSGSHVLILTALSSYFFICIKNKYDEMGHEAASPQTTPNKLQTSV